MAVASRTVRNSATPARNIVKDNSIERMLESESLLSLKLAVTLTLGDLNAKLYWD